MKLKMDNSNEKIKNIEITEENRKLLELYNLAELTYQKHFQSLVTDIVTLYPEGWYEKQNYRQKIEIIAEAIKENTLIENTVKYQNSIERMENVLIKE